MIGAGMAYDAIAMNVIDDDPKASAKVLDAIFTHGIKPHADAIAEVVESGDIAIVVHRLRPDVERNARALGWDGVSPVFRMTESTRARMIASSEAIADTVTARWLRAKRTGRVFVLSGVGSLLVNVDEDGFSIEPGSTDERATA
jgi:hypothetical protein